MIILLPIASGQVLFTSTVTIPCHLLALMGITWSTVLSEHLQVCTHPRTCRAWFALRATCLARLHKVGDWSICSAFTAIVGSNFRTQNGTRISSSLRANFEVNFWPPTYGPSKAHKHCAKLDTLVKLTKVLPDVTTTADSRHDVWLDCVL